VANRGRPLFPFSCPASDHFWNPPASASAACCRSGQRSLPSLLPPHPHDHDRPAPAG
jgi:hypothetical protein